MLVARAAKAGEGPGSCTALLAPAFQFHITLLLQASFQSV
jgi:hypothetical protein